MADPALVQVVVVVSPAPREVREVVLTLPAGATVAQALESSGLLAPGACEPGNVGVWRRKAALTQVLRNHDRVEVYRPLLVDPKAARRERFARQGARSAGLFAKRRAGAKAGY